MLSEIFFLKLEAKARMASPDERSTKRSDERFIPLALPAAQGVKR